MIFMTLISMHYVIICVVFSGAYMICTRLCSLNPGVTKDQLEYHGSLYLNNIPLRGISTIWSLSCLTQMISNEHKTKGGNRNTHQSKSSGNNTHTQDKNEHTKQHNGVTTQRSARISITMNQMRVCEVSAF